MQAVAAKPTLTLPPLLEQYGYKQNPSTTTKEVLNIEKGHKHEKKDQPAQRKEIQQKKSISFRENTKPKKRKERWIDERELERQQQKREHNLEVYFNAYETRDDLVETYLDNLRAKIDKQREDIQLSSQYMQHIEQYRREMRAKRARNAIRKQMQHQKLSHNDAFLKGIEKSRYYTMVSMIDSFKKSGLIRTRADEDEFWRDIEAGRMPAQLKPRDTLQQNKQTGSASSTDSLLTSDDTQQHSPEHRDRQLTLITESRESGSRPPTRTNTQLTYKPFTQLHLDPDAISRQAAQNLDKLYPQVEEPDLACFRLELKSPPPDPNQVAAEHAARRRDKERKFFVRKLRQMYSVSLANTAQTNRIMEKHPDSEYYQAPTIEELTGLLTLTQDPASLHFTTAGQHGGDDGDDDDGVDDGDITSGDADQGSTGDDITYTSPAFHGRSLYLHKPRRRSIMPILEVQESSTEHTDDQPSSDEGEAGVGERGGGGLSASNEEPPHVGLPTITDADDATHRPENKTRSAAVKTPEMPAYLPLSIGSALNREKTMEAKCLSTLWRNYTYNADTKK